MSAPVHAGIPAQGGCLLQCMLGYTPPPVDRILDTRLSKHYLSATTDADGKNSTHRHVHVNSKSQRDRRAMHA